MEIMDFHEISKLMNCDRHFSPALLQEFFATVHFSTKGPRAMTWMSGGVKCQATLAEFGALFGIEEAVFTHFSHIRIHGEERLILKARTGIRHCYPPGVGTQYIPKVKYFTDFWYVTHTILRNTIHVKFGEKGNVRKWMINLLHHIVKAKNNNKKLDVMDYMWNEMKNTVLGNKVPIYGSYIQTLIDSKVPAQLVNNYRPLTIPTMRPLLTASQEETAPRSK